MTKSEIRDKMKAMRRALSKDDAALLSRSITEKVCSLPCFVNAGTVMTYISAFKEPDTAAIIENTLLNNKKCVVPVSNTDTHTITPVYITDTLVKGAYGIPEPDIINEADISDIDIALIPGIAFDMHGNRTGFGMGYYDRFLSQFKGLKIGLCYDFQLLPSIPADEHDIRMDLIITEKRIYDDF